MWASLVVKCSEHCAANLQVRLDSMCLWLLDVPQPLMSKVWPFEASWTTTTPTSYYCMSLCVDINLRKLTVAKIFWHICMLIIIQPWQEHDEHIYFRLNRLKGGEVCTQSKLNITFLKYISFLRVTNVLHHELWILPAASWQFRWTKYITRNKWIVWVKREMLSISVIQLLANYEWVDCFWSWMA